MLQAALSDCHFLDLLPFPDDGFVAPKIDVCRCDVVQALMVALVVVVIDEGPDLMFEITGQIVVFQQNPVLHRLVPALDLALGLRVERGSANVIHFVVLQPFGQIARDIAGSVITQQATQDEMTVAEALNIYATEHAPTVADPARIAYAIGPLVRFWGELPVSAIKRESCRAYCRQRRKVVKRDPVTKEVLESAPASVGTTRKELGTLAAAVNYCASEGHLVNPPAVRLP